MNKLLRDQFTLKLLKLICSGEGVNINVSQLSRDLNKHRNTIKERIKQLYEHKIIEKPIYPLLWLFEEYPLLVISKDKFYRDEVTKIFIENDPHIFAAFFFQEEFYNTLTIQFHKDLYSYQTWCEKIIEEEKIIKEEDRHPPDALLFSTKSILKYDPSAPYRIIERSFKNGVIKQIGDYELDELSLAILKNAMKAKGIRTNESYLARKLNVNRNTVIRRIQALLQEGIIGKPVSRFPRVIVPPDFMLIFSLIEIRRQCEIVEKYIRKDSHIPLLIKANVGKYNYFAAGTFNTIEDHLEWQEDCTQKFRDCIEGIKSTYLSPAMTFSISQNYVSLELIKRKLQIVREKEEKRRERREKRKREREKRARQ
ncbi:MAG: hypothetical protein ACFE95_04615 [Candidatus Hodarchaeota archaeon]